AVALEDLDRRRLARAVRAEEPEDLARLDREVDPAHRLEVPVRLAQAADLDRGHPWRSLDRAQVARSTHHVTRVARSGSPSMRMPGMSALSGVGTASTSRSASTTASQPAAAKAASVESRKSSSSSPSSRATRRFSSSSGG